MKGNKAIVKNHFGKSALRYKEWHGLEVWEQIREKKRIIKAKKVFPKPVEWLRPIVRCRSIRYNRNERLGRGFTEEELKAAGLTIIKARGLQIAHDPRRKDSNKEAFDQNVERIKTYLSKITIYNSMEEARAAKPDSYMKNIMPVKPKVHVVPAITKDQIASYE